MKNLFLGMMSLFLCATSAFAEYTVDGRDKAAEQTAVSRMISLDLLAKFAIQRSVVDFDTIYSFSLVEDRMRDYVSYPEDGVLMLKLGNEETLKLFRAPVAQLKKTIYSKSGGDPTYHSVCLYNFEPGMLEKVVENGITKVRIQYVNNQQRDIDIRSKKLERQNQTLKNIKSDFEKKIEDDF